ncbi:SDR family oxidoreductase [Gordonia sp. i37]|uniref:SDR family NAD(P)-dependent oxidoreductase n=1 Tax=Gordonia sp. i37 TaxID=1961707 RepID=UPI001C0E4E2A|nr:SDR family oxidoreductase [Gordonia sp. i37]
MSASEPATVVTGASSGIGAAITRRLLDDGRRVIGLSRRDPGLTDDHFEWLAADLTDTVALRETLAGIGRIDAIVHAAGLQRSGFLGSLDPDDGLAMWRVHVTAAEVVVDALAPRIRDGGRIVLIGSRTMTGNPGKSQYAATKAALTGMARSWAAEVIERGITVNVVAPGPTETPMLTDPARAETPVRVPPSGRLVQPEEVAALVAFLLGPFSGSITGQTIVQCGGVSL